MTPRVLVLEGPDGCGKSSHADRLAAALRAEGVDARAFHHTKPADADPILAALDYARQRRVLCLHAEPGEVIVADRWTWSTWALGRALMMRSGSVEGEALRGFADAEITWGPMPPQFAQVILTAPGGALDGRLAARGTPATKMDRLLRDAYECQRGRWRFIDTSRPADVVAAELLAWARSALEGSA